MAVDDQAVVVALTGDPGRTLGQGIGLDPRGDRDRLGLEVPRSRRDGHVLVSIGLQRTIDLTARPLRIAADHAIVAVAGTVGGDLAGSFVELPLTNQLR